MKASQILMHTSARSALTPEVFTAQDAADFDLSNLSELAALGLGLDASGIRQMAVALDAAPDLLEGGPANGVYVQFLRNFLPGVIGVMTQARKIDELVGMSTAGAWSDEEVIQETMTPVGIAVPYTDKGNVPLASYDTRFVKRGVVRFENGFELNRLEADRASRMRANAAQRKRNSVALSLNIQRNRVGFYGYAAASAPIYGFLNDPNLGAYNTVDATGTGGTTTWSTKDFMAITGDMREAIGALQVQMGGNFNPRTDRFTVAISTASATYLTVTNIQGGVSVEEWFKKTYPNARIVDAMELEGANGGQNVFYIYLETVSGEEGSDDNGRTFDQIVPTILQQLGVEQKAKGFLEDYTNATCGVFTKRPYAVWRGTGI